MGTSVCECGCGEPTRVSRRFKPGHNTRMDSTPRNWKGGKPRVDGGYVEVYAPKHPRANYGGRVQEHILIVEKALGKLLPLKAVVHHVDGSKTHNSAKNLVVCEDQKYHMLLEQRTRALIACGNPDWRKCQFCKTYDDLENLYVTTSGAARHRACFNTYRRDQRRLWAR